MRQSPLLLSILAALTSCSETFEDTGCFNVPAEQTSCPNAGAVDPGDLYLPNQCGDDLEIDEVLSGGTRQDVPLAGTSTVQPACCYRVEVVDSDPEMTCTIGRPYCEGNQHLRAPVRERGRRSSHAAQARAKAWADAGAGEHASVAAFARLSLELMALGAPSDLLSGVHQAALDEVRHAEQCWALARRFGGTTRSAGAFPFPDRITVTRSLPDLAAAALHEGCLAETLGAHLVATAAALAPETEVRAALEAIAADEAKHAVLSFKIVAWSLRAGGAPVRAALEARLAETWPRLDVEELALRSNVDALELYRAAEAGVSQVLRPAVAALLA